MLIKKALWCMLVLLLVFGIALAGFASVWPQSSGEKKKTDEDLTIDYSNVTDGYIMVKAKKSKKKLKLRIEKDDETYTYDITGGDDYAVFPLSMGNGSYKCTLYKNVKGKSYAEDGQITVKVDGMDKNAPFLCPNRYVNYDKDTAAVSEALSLCEGMTDESEIFETIRSYIAKNYVYDFITAVTVETGTLQVIDRCYKNKMGICQDLSALACCMLRVNGVAAKMAVGYADKNYHAWVYVIIDGKEQLYDPTAELNAIAKVKEYTLEQTY